MDISELLEKLDEALEKAVGGNQEKMAAEALIEHQKMGIKHAKKLKRHTTNKGYHAVANRIITSHATNAKDLESAKEDAEETPEQEAAEGDAT